MLLRKYMLLNKKRLIINQNVKLNSIIFFLLYYFFHNFIFPEFVMENLLKDPLLGLSRLLAAESTCKYVFLLKVRVSVGLHKTFYVLVRI